MKILFYYPQHFNRSAEGTNPFFDELLKVCDEAGIQYDLMEEPDGGTDRPRNPHAKKADRFFRTVWFLRNLAKLFSRDFYKRERIAAKMLNVLNFGKYRYDKYITISGSMFHFFAALNPKARVYDMQHGVLGKFHTTFFDDKKKLRQQFYNPQLHWLFWGKGYDECFIRGEEQLLKDRTHVVGYPLPVEDKIANADGRNVILFSLQFTADWDKEMLQRQKKLFEQQVSVLEDCGYEVLLRHHPRYNNVINIDDVLQKYPYVKVTKAPLSELLDKVLLQITFNSTTAFEYAQMGIPSFFMHNDQFPHCDNLMYEEYLYPLYENKSLREVVDHLATSEAFATDGKIVNEWYNRFYTPFDKEAFLNLLRS